MIGATEINFDGIVGPTHHYGGLAAGNLASQKHRHRISNPKAAALEGLAKMRRLSEMGHAQAVLPPLPRPDVTVLRRLGFGGRDADVLASAARDAPLLLAAASSASSMWAANAATVSPSADTLDGKVHITAANLVSQFHRSIEARQTAWLLRRIFHDPVHFVHHDPLPASPMLGDEGAANHSRLTLSHELAGVEVFTFGRAVGDEPADGPRVHPARQTLEASRCIARLHQLRPKNTLFLRQNPAGIDAGAFHHDVLAVAHRDVLFCHERAFADGPALADIRLAVQRASGHEPRIIEIADSEVPLETAIATYLFNSQLLSRADGNMTLIAPAECQQTPATRNCLARLLALGEPIREVVFVEVRQSMQNGGGPACLRLRVAVTPAEMAAIHQGCMLTPDLAGRLETWINRHYRDHLEIADLADPKLLEESRFAIDELTKVLELGPVFHFQAGAS